MFSKCLLDFFSCENSYPAEAVAGYGVRNAFENLVGLEEAKSNHRREVEDECAEAGRGNCPEPHKKVIGIGLIFCVSAAGNNTALNGIFVAGTDGADGEHGYKLNCKHFCFIGYGIKADDNILEGKEQHSGNNTENNENSLHSFCVGTDKA